MIMLIGVALFLVAFVLLWIARPRGGEMATLLRGRYVQEYYAVGIVGFIGMGLACIFGGLAGMAG
jgi:hypothetical protein